ncbi:oxoglutarate-Fe(II) type oxidoreductase [Seminavis robusta]|uniref:Oxoglutarate-Fe(II) type oxidoreductase n=1 Tax=Seminavis robusta TaxID=568900 RepID=A0A9N8DWE3_9STRA|nr:oxoglutarate-Fe(II) type oxidoreductase [Seminavis robusta]|eukprot:Sro414_g138200.1 oxoglutarate-Fe(II) type oxidoreductase (325) ;mRNA; f:5681-6760
MATSKPQDEGFAIPQIDMSKDEESVVAELYAALTTTGFATLTGHGISKELREKAFAASKAFFLLPTEEKLKCAYQGHRSNRGYIGIGKETHETSASSDYKETFDINVDESSGFSQPWPSSTGSGPLETFQQNLIAYFDAMDKLHLTVMRLISIGLGLPPNYLCDRCNERHENLRLLHYPHMPVSNSPSKEPRSRGAIHSDFGTITLLNQDGVGGLRVQCRNDTWVFVEPVDDAVVVNVGDMLQRWTNGILKATLHQVVEVPSKNGETYIPERYSIAFFCNANKDTLLECLPPCVSEDRPAQYEPVNAHDYLTMRLSATIDASSS